MAKPVVEVGTWSDKSSRSAPGSATGSAAGRTTDPNTAVAALEGLAWLLDASIPLPGTRFRIGLDSVIGLIPGIGDAIGALISSYILFVAAKLGVPRVTLMRMGFNAAVDALVGIVPFAGDVFDAAWKANLRNVALLRAHVENPTRARRGDWLFASLFVFSVMGLLGLLGWGGLFLALKL